MYQLLVQVDVVVNFFVFISGNFCFSFLLAYGDVC